MVNIMRYILVMLSITLICAGTAGAELPHRYGIFGGFSAIDYGGGFPERFQGVANERNYGAYTGFTAGYYFSDGDVRPGIDFSPQYVLSGVDSFFQIHNIFLPVYATLSLGHNIKYDLGVGTGPMFLDMFRDNDFGWGIFARASTLFPALEDYGGRVGPDVQFFTDLTTSGDNIWGVLLGIRFEIER